MALLRPYTPRKPFVPAKIKHEESLQKQICTYLKLQFPSVIFRSDYASGLHLTMNQAVIHKSLQSGRSFPDLFLFAPRVHGNKHYCGMALELKREHTAIYVTRGPRKGELVADPHLREQALMISELNALGYFARFGVGFDNCRRLIDWYLQPGYKEPVNASIF